MTILGLTRVQDKVAMLKRLSMFAACTPEQLHLIADRTRLVEHKKGEFIYRQGDTATALYIVSSGRVRVFSRQADDEQTLAVLHNGDAFGEISLLTGENHVASVQALNDTLILQIAKADFDDVINRVPSLVLYLSRLLSRRLRTRAEVGTYAEAKIAAIYSGAKGVGRSLFAVSLAAMLKRDTGMPVIVVDLNVEPAGSDPLYAGGTLRSEGLPGLAELLPEAPWPQLVREHPLGFTVLSIGQVLHAEPDDRVVAPLLNVLTHQFHYVLLDLPVEVDAQVLKALRQSDVIYLMTDQHRDNVAKTRTLLHQVHDTVGVTDARVQVVVNRMQGIGVAVSIGEIGRELGAAVTFALPRAPVSTGERVTIGELSQWLEQHRLPYMVAVRRVARELSGSVVALVLGSGAALGLAHVGVLKVLERENIPVDIVCGSSIGSLVGGLWASGRSAAELEQLALRFAGFWSFLRLFVLDVGFPMFSVVLGVGVGVAFGVLAGFWPGVILGSFLSLVIWLILGPLAGGPIQGRQLMQKLEADFAGKTFDDTWVPLRVVAANPIGREEVVFDSGPLAGAVRASVSIPGIFKPAIRRGRLCLDGGVVNPVPVSVARQAGAHRVIAVNVFPTTQEMQAHLAEVERQRQEREAQLASRGFLVRLFARLRQEVQRSMFPIMFDIIMRSMQFMEHQIAEVACHEADLTLRPTLPGASWLEFYAPAKFIRRGEETALQHLAEIKRVAGMGGPFVDKGTGSS